MSDASPHEKLGKKKSKTNGGNKQRKRPLNNEGGEAEPRPSAKKNSRSAMGLLYDFYCVIDFECTCEEHLDSRTYPHEIIEFPAILIDARTRLVAAEFHSYCRPVKNARLSKFCSSLTGIQQETVDKAPLFEDVAKDFQRWLAEKVDNLGKTVAFIVDGPADFGRFLQCQYSLIGQDVPDRFHQWIDIRIAFQNCVDIWRPHLMSMLTAIGLAFEGRRHSGMDDARNIAKIAIWLLERRGQLWVNHRLEPRQLQDYESGECTDDEDGNGPLDSDLFSATAKSTLKYLVVPVREKEAGQCNSTHKLKKTS